jgi:putative flippase GtrA
MKELFKKIFNRETVLYVVFGALTTLVNFVVFEAMKLLTGSVHLRNIVAWIAAVAFAYVTNKLFVFESKSWAPALVGKEVAGFAGARLFSLGVEELGLFVFINLCHFDRFHLPLTANLSLDGDLLTKVGLSVIVLIMNYLFSKFVIFRKKQEETKEDETT